MRALMHPFASFSTSIIQYLETASCHSFKNVSKWDHSCGTKHLSRFWKKVGDTEFLGNLNCAEHSCKDVSHKT